MQISDLRRLLTLVEEELIQYFSGRNETFFKGKSYFLALLHLPPVVLSIRYTVSNVSV
jgi:hypothetical protein